MSQENVELVRRVFDSINRGDVDASLEEAADDLEVDWSNSIGPTKGIYRGRREVLKLWRSFLDAWDSLQWDPEEIIDVDESRVIAVNHVRMRGHGSGVDVDARGAQLWTISDGKARSLKLFQSKAEALEAAGLRE
ncbi:MAG: nuclear transport factor 2 family protein [Solirubrobacterales bacterium]